MGVDDGLQALQASSLNNAVTTDGEVKLGIVLANGGELFMVVDRDDAKVMGAELTRVTSDFPTPAKH